MSEAALWVRPGVEPSLGDLLSDPIVQALMQADGVCVRDLVRRLARPDPTGSSARSEQRLQRALDAALGGAG